MNKDKQIFCLPSLYIRKYPIRLTAQHMAMNLAYKIEISKLLENVDAFANNP